MQRLEDINNQSDVFESNFSIGDHLVSPRSLYKHHGLYVGNGDVIHYSGFANGLSSGSITIASISDFSNGNDVYVEQHLNRQYDGDTSVQRAYQRLGEDWYNVLINNCEHFVTWCVMGVHSSSQVNSLIAAAALTRDLIIPATNPTTS